MKLYSIEKLPNLRVAIHDGIAVGNKKKPFSSTESSVNSKKQKIRIWIRAERIE